MQCPGCGHDVANGRTECMHCGAAFKDTASEEILDLLFVSNRVLCARLQTQRRKHIRALKSKPPAMRVVVDSRKG